MIAAALTSPKAIKCSPLKSGIATVTVCAFESDVIVKPNKKSFQTLMKERIAVVKTPGAASGRITRHKVPRRLHPSILAASSRSGGNSRKNDVRKYTVIGKEMSR